MPKTLQITFNNAVPAPALGYGVRYRVVGTTTWNEVKPNPTASPVSISVPEGFHWEVGVRAVCSAKVSSPEQLYYADDRAAATAYAGSGYGNMESEACSDAITNNRTFYSQDTTLGINSALFLDEALTQPITGYTHVFTGGMNWDINNQGQIIAVSANQC